jgi:hypothetical protein
VEKWIHDPAIDMRRSDYCRNSFVVVNRGIANCSKKDGASEGQSAS